MTARVGFASSFDDATLTATSEALAVENLQDPAATKVWRSTDLAQQTIKWDYGSGNTPDHNFIHLLNTNLTTSAEIVVEHSSDDFADTFLYSNSFSVWSKNLAHKEATHYYDGTSSQIADSGGTVIADAGGTKIASGTWTVPVSARYGRIVINDPTNTDGYVEIGRILTGRYFNAPNSKNVTVGPRLSYVERGAFTQTRGGGFRAEQRTPQRQIDVVWEWAKEADSYDIDANSFAEMLEEAGRRTDVFVAVFPDDSDDRARRFTMVGRMIRNSGLETHEQTLEGGSLVAWQRLRATFLEAL